MKVLVPLLMFAVVFFILLGMAAALWERLKTRLTPQTGPADKHTPACHRRPTKPPTKPPTKLPTPWRVTSPNWHKPTPCTKAGRLLIRNQST